MNEKAWQEQVVTLARYYGWMHFHPYDMRRSDAGWPDLTFVRPPELIFVELKTEKGRLTPAQECWLSLLARSGQRVFVWRPSMFDVIHEVLKRREGVNYGTRQTSSTREAPAGAGREGSGRDRERSEQEPLDGDARRLQGEGASRR